MLLLAICQRHHAALLYISTLYICSSSLELLSPNIPTWLTPVGLQNSAGESLPDRKSFQSPLYFQSTLGIPLAQFSSGCSITDWSVCLTSLKVRTMSCSYTPPAPNIVAIHMLVELMNPLGLNSNFTYSEMLNLIPSFKVDHPTCLLSCYILSPSCKLMTL